MQPSEIKYHRSSRELELVFPDAGRFVLSAEFLRVYSPSAEVKGHHPNQAVLQVEKQDVSITGIQAQGNYAIRIIFDDAHDSGIYTWDYLFELSTNHDDYWQDYLRRLKAAGARRKSNIIARSAPQVWNPDNSD